MGQGYRRATAIVLWMGIVLPLAHADGLPLPAAGGAARFEAALAALSGDPDGVVPLRSGGQLRSEPVGGVDLIRKGKRRSLQLLALTGMAPLPTLVWVTEGAEPRLFAYPGPHGPRIVEPGWGSVADALEDREARAIEEEGREVLARIAHPVEGSLLLRDVRVFDSELGVLGPPSSVLVEDGRVARVHEGTPDVAMRKATWVVEGGGRVLLPGLFDGPPDSTGWMRALQLAAGVTTLRGAPVEPRPDPTTGPVPDDLEDAIARATLQHRLEHAVASGADPVSVLRAATWEAARDAGLLHERGAIEAGKRAELVLVDGDPTHDIRALRRIVLVLDGDTLHYPDEIRRTMGLPVSLAPVRPATPSKRRDERRKLESGVRDMPNDFPG